MIYLGADHGGFAVKEQIKQWLASGGYEMIDMGAPTLVPDDDYPIYAQAVALKIQEDPEKNRGILLCRSGGGMAIAANRFKEVRAVDCKSVEEAVHARQHNDANVLTLPAEWVTGEQAIDIVQAFLTTPFSGEQRHIQRIKKIDE